MNESNPDNPQPAVPVNSEEKEVAAGAGIRPDAIENAVPAAPRKPRTAKRAPVEPEGSDDESPAARPDAPADAADGVRSADQPMPADAGTGEINFEDVVSGRFDAEEASPESPDAAPTKRVLAPQYETPKLHKVLAQAGLGSRLEMEQLILEGRISVNNEPAHIGQRVQYGDQVKVNGKPIRYRIDPPPPRIIAYHKPVGEVVTHDDPQNRPTVFRKLPRLQHGKWQSVGRLDLNTEGLLLFTSSGELANKLMHPRFGLEREYAVRVLGALSNEEKQKLLDGVRLDDGMAQFGTIENGGGEGANTWYRVTISEGRNREVRRMLEAVGHAVSRLIRIRYGAMLLPRGLKRGAWMELDERDIDSLMKAAGAERRETAPAFARASEAPRNRRGGNGPRGAGGPGQGARGGAGSGFGRPEPGHGPMFGGPATARSGPPAGKAAGPQPDPMKTSVGYIGADSFSRQQRQGPKPGGPGGGRRGGGGGGRGR